MNSKTNKVLLVALLGVLGFIAPLAVVQAQTLTIGADYWYPMNGEPNADKPGYMIELAKAIFNKKGVAVDYQLMPWPRALELARIGDIDCVVGAYKNDAPDFLYPNDNWGVDRTVFYVLKDDAWRYQQSLDSLEHRQIGVISGYSYGKQLDEYFAKHKVQSVKGDHALDINIKKLIAERVNTLIESEYVMANKLSELKLTNKIISAGKTMMDQPVYIACGPNKERSKAWINIINQSMEQIKNDGTYSRILHRYGIDSR